MPHSSPIQTGADTALPPNVAAFLAAVAGALDTGDLPRQAGQIIAEIKSVLGAVQLDGEYPTLPPMWADTMARGTARLTGADTALDSESWTCRSCGAQFIGRRTPDDLCASCLSFRLTGVAR